MTWRNIWRRRDQPYHLSRLRVSCTKFFSHWYSYTQTESSTEIWNHRTCSLVRMEILSNLLILVSLVLLVSQSKPTHMKLSLYGTDAQRFSYHKSTTHLVWTYGQLVVSSLRWPKRDHCSWVIVKLIKSSKYLKSSELQMSTTGLMPSSFKTSNPHSQNSEAFQCKTILKDSMS